MPFPVRILQHQNAEGLQHIRELEERKEEKGRRKESGSYQYPQPGWRKGTRDSENPMNLPFFPFPGASGLEFEARGILALQILE